MKRTIKHFLNDALEYCEKVENFTKGLNYEEFASDEKTFLATIRSLEVIGEALKNIPDETRKKHPEIPWREIIGFRNTVAHVYFGINEKIVWNTVKQDIPYLKELLKIMINENTD